MTLLDYSMITRHFNVCDLVFSEMRELPYLWDIRILKVELIVIVAISSLSYFAKIIKPTPCTLSSRTKQISLLLLGELSSIELMWRTVCT